MEVVVMGGFTGFKTAAVEELPDAVAVMDSFHVVRLAGEVPTTRSPPSPTSWPARATRSRLRPSVRPSRPSPATS
jgi:transposase